MQAAILMNELDSFQQLLCEINNLFHWHSLRTLFSYIARQVAILKEFKSKMELFLFILANKDVIEPDYVWMWTHLSQAFYLSAKRMSYGISTLLLLYCNELQLMLLNWILYLLFAVWCRMPCTLCHMPLHQFWIQNWTSKWENTNNFLMGKSLQVASLAPPVIVRFAALK